MGEKLERFFREVGQELKKQAAHGAAEAAHALYNGHGYVPYGHSAERPPDKEKDREKETGQERSEGQDNERSR